MRDGDRVAAGDLVMRLDEVITRANLGIVAGKLNEFAVRQTRLKAERDGSASVEIPLRLADRQAEADIAEIIAGERALFASRSTARAEGRLGERISQLREEIGGVEAQQRAKANELELIDRELGEMRSCGPNTGCS